MRKKGTGKVISFNKKKGVLIEGFDDLKDKDLDALSEISQIKDLDNKRAFFRKKKASKSKSKRKTKGCGCK